MKRTILASAIVGVTLAYSSVVAAQTTTPAPSNPNILTAIQQLQQSDVQEAAVLQGIQSTLTAIQAALQPTVGNVARTPPLAIGDLLPTDVRAFTCTVANVSTQSRTVLISLLDQNGTPFFSDVATLTLLPGTSSFLSVGAGADAFKQTASLRCNFVVQNGTKQDIIGAITRDDSTSTGVTLSSTSLPAQ
jgi:hypothetical protein